MNHTPPLPEFPPPAPAPRRNRTNTIIISSAAAVIAAIVTTGVIVANSRDAEQPPTVAKAAAPPSASSSPSPPPKQETLRLGDAANISADVEFTAAALSYDDTGVTGVPEMLSTGQKWAVLMVKVCNKDAAPIETTTFVWSLAYADGVRVEPAGMNAGELPQPVYPMEAKVSSGDCVKGNIAFQVPRGGRPERVLYSPDGLDGPVEWLVK